MCGIAGIVNLEQQPVMGELLRNMNVRLRHRGPDDEGYMFIQQRTGQYAEFSGEDSSEEVRNSYPLLSACQHDFAGNIGLAHRRYSIIDLSIGGHQPLFDSERICCVIFNGEIYNYIELREELQGRGHVFRTNSDTEVIVEAYKSWGEECFEHFNGMWALALYDFKRQMLLLSRDRIGKLPLYWTKHHNTIYFASEIKALLTIPEIDHSRSVNQSAIFPFIAYSLRDVDDMTFFEGIYTFPAASWAVLNQDFPNNVRQYWKIPTERLSEHDIPVKKAMTSIREILTDAVRIRLRSDVPWCIQLSGGMDSSAVVALAAQLTNEQLITYTVRFPDRKWNEEPFARSVAKYYGTDYHVIESPMQNFWHEIQPFTYLQEEPYHSPNLHVTQTTFRIMRTKGIKMLLNGAAGDELFAGYNEYFRYAQLEYLLSGRLKTCIDNELHWSERSKGGGLVKQIANLVKRSVGKLMRMLGVTPGTFVYINAPYSWPQLPCRRLSEKLYQDMTRTKMPYWQRSGDKAYMGVPLEARRPFLDYRMVELVFSLPVMYLIRHGWHKWILRKALEDILPYDVVWRKHKMGFPFPWERFSIDSYIIIETILRHAQNPFLDLSNQNNLKNNWRLISFMLWYELFFNNNLELFQKITEIAAQSNQVVEYGYHPEFLTSCLLVKQ